MEFRDLKAQYQALKDNIDTAILEVLEGGNYIMGRQVVQLEEALANYVGVKHCITCANGTDALSLILMALKIKKGDAVFIPNFTFFATGEVVAFEGATPIFVDIDETTFNIDCQKLEEAIGKVKRENNLVPKAIIAVDLFGLPADYKRLEAIADKYDLMLLEDSAQGFGGSIGNRKAGSFGHAATTSFFPAKPLGCYGDGGAVFTNDDTLAKQIQSLRVHGKGNCKYDNVQVGMNSRLDTIQAAILLQKFKAFIAYELEAVNKVARSYSEQLGAIIKVPIVPNGYYSSWAQYSIQCSSEEQRNNLMKELKQQNIPTMIYYPKPMHEQVAFNELNQIQGDFEITNKICKTILALPIHPYLKEAEIAQICDRIKQIIG